MCNVTPVSVCLPLKISLKSFNKEVAISELLSCQKLLPIPTCAQRDERQSASALREKSSILTHKTLQNLQTKQMYRGAKLCQKLKFTTTGAPIWLNKSGKGSKFDHCRSTVCLLRGFGPLRPPPRKRRLLSGWDLASATQPSVQGLILCLLHSSPNTAEGCTQKTGTYRTLGFMISAAHRKSEVFSIAPGGCRAEGAENQGSGKACKYPHVLLPPRNAPPTLCSTVLPSLN